MDDKHALKVTSAGMRLIALLTFFNGDDDERLRRFVAESYHADLLADSGAEERTSALRAMRAASGKLKVQQVLGVSKEHVIVLLTSQNESQYVVDIAVGEDYPHSITSIKFSGMVTDDAGA